MWSSPDAGRDPAGAGRPIRRGQIWLAAMPAPQPRGLVLVLSGDAGGSGPPVQVSPLLPAQPHARGCVTLDEMDGFEVGATVDLRRIMSLEPHELVLAVASLAPRRMEQINSALCDVLGIPAPAPSALPLPVVEAPGNGAVQDGYAFAPPPPPAPPQDAPPPAMESDRRAEEPRTWTDEQHTWAEGSRHTWAQEPEHSRGDESVGIDEHPIAQLFGQPARAAHEPEEPRPAAAPELGILRPSSHDVHVDTPTRAAAVIDELLEIVRRRLHRSAPRLEGVLIQAADEGRSVQWVAAAVRHTAVRGVMQSTLDEIAQEISAVGARHAGRY